jgi:hypothetical protein
MEIKEIEGRTKRTEFILMGAHFLLYTECINRIYTLRN